MRVHSFVMLLAISLPAVVEADEDVARFLSTLRSKHLDGLLERYCFREIRESTLSRTLPTLTAELATSFATRATEDTNDESRRDRWRSADSIIKLAMERAEDPFTQAELLFQRVNLAYTEGDWLFQWDQLHGRLDDAPSAIARLTDAVDLARQLLDRLGRINAQARDRERKEFVQSLDAQTRYRLGATLLLLGSCHPAQSPQRIDNLRLSIQYLASLVEDDQQTNQPEQVLLTLAEAQRRAGLIAESHRSLDRLAERSLSDEMSDRAVAERVECLLAERKILPALEILHEKRRGSPTPKPEWEHLYLKILLEQASLMRNDPGAVSKLQASALQQLRTLETFPDRSWLKRSEQLLRLHAPDLMLSDTSEYEQAGEVLLRLGDYAQAGKVFHQAAEQSASQGESARASAFHFQSARAWEWAGEYRRAREAFVRAKAVNPSDPTSASLLLRASLAARKVYVAEKKPDDYQHLNQLTDQLLEEYPDSAEADEAHYLRGTLRKAERRFDRAIEEFLAIPSGRRLTRLARLAASRVYESWKEPLITEINDATLGQVIAYHDQLLADPLLEWSAAEKAELAVRSAKFLLDRRVDRPADARDRLLDALALPALPHDWHERIRRYLLLSYVNLQDFVRAEEIADVQAKSGALEVLDSASLLCRDADMRNAIERHALGRVESKLLQDVATESASLSNEEKKAWRIAVARSLLHLGDKRAVLDAVRQFEELNRQHPNDAQVLRLLGDSYLAADRSDAAVQTILKLIGGLPPGSPSWFRAKLQLIRAYRAGSRTSDAIKTLKLLELLHPDLGGPRLYEEFQKEKKRLEA